MGTHFKRSSAMQHLAPFLVVPLALTVATMPVERIGGVVGISEGTGATDSSEDFRGVYRECLGCDSAFDPYPYHLFNSEARHDLAKRAPLPKKPFPFPLAFKKPKAKKPFKPFGKKFFPFFGKKGKKSKPAFGKFGKKSKPAFGKKGKKSKPAFGKNGKKSKPKFKKGGKKSKPKLKKGGKGASKFAKASAPISIPSFGAGAPALGLGIPAIAVGGFGLGVNGDGGAFG